MLRATWNQVKDINDLVNEVLEFLKDYPDKPIRQQNNSLKILKTCTAKKIKSGEK